MLTPALDLSQIKTLAPDYRRAFKEALDRVTEQGAVITREEVPYERLRKGVKAEPAAKLPRGKVTIEALSDPVLAGRGVMHYPSGRTRDVRVRAQRPVNIARFVAEGTGIYGPYGVVNRSKRAGRPLRIPVKVVRPDEPYLEVDGRYFVYRMYAKGMRPNPFMDRAADKLEAQAPEIAERVIGERL